MIRNKSFINFISAISVATVLLVTITGRAIHVFALAVGPLADPVYDTEIIAFKDYVEANLDAPELDIMFFLIGGLAVAQMGAQDAMLISPYPNEENVKEWIINCGIQLYNSVIGLVPEGDYYMGIPSIGTDGQKGVPRQVIKALVAQMMGDAVVAANYSTLDDFLEENSDKILLPFNADLQLGVNAIFGINGGMFDWSTSSIPISYLDFFNWHKVILSDVSQSAYNSLFVSLNFLKPVRANFYDTSSVSNLLVDFAQSFVIGNSTYNYFPYTEIFFNTSNNIAYLVDSNGNTPPINVNMFPYVELYYRSNSNSVGSNSSPLGYHFRYNNFNFSSFNTIKEAVEFLFTNSSFFVVGDQMIFDLSQFVERITYGTSFNDRQNWDYITDLNINDNALEYYQQVTNDYLFDLRGLMGDLVNYVYLNPIWDNIYDLVGNLVVPDRINVSVDLTPITDLLAPPLPVNLNDIDLYTDNDYLHEIKDRSTKFGETLGEYFVFWHNSDPMMVYVIFGSVIVILIGAFIGKWGHS